MILQLYTKTSPSLSESSTLSNTSFPHIIPVLSLLERGVALGEALEPWESAEVGVGVDVVMYHLEAARTIAHHGEIYRTNTETKLQGKSVSNEEPMLYYSDILVYGHLRNKPAVSFMRLIPMHI